MTAYLMGQRMRRKLVFPMVLMLEPLHACNLKCSGCGRIREYSESMNQRMSLDECLASLDECGAPILSICGGEPLIYPELQQLVDETIRRKKHIYLCTNGLLLAEKLNLFKPSSRLMLNIHLDGMQPTHDAITCRDGTFDQVIEGIRAAKKNGFIVYTNTTVYGQTSIDELAELFGLLTEMKVDGFMLSPAYSYQAVRDDSDGSADDLFMSRESIIKKFTDARSRLEKFRLVTSPLYFDFLCGQRDLPCAAWANPTRNVAGWRGPCYFICDRHYDSYREMVEATDWSLLGHELAGQGGDPRCRDCMAHCGFEPSAVLNNQGLRDMLKMARWQFS